MSLTFLSWNIRNLRVNKWNQHIDQIKAIVEQADVCFFYEAHAQMRGAEKIDDFVPIDIPVQDELVYCLYRSDIELEILTTVPHGVQEAYGRGERRPASVQVTKDGVTLTVGAWHAYGPAKQSVSLLHEKILRVDFYDIVMGDFNYQSHGQVEIVEDAMITSTEDWRQVSEDGYREIEDEREADGTNKRSADGEGQPPAKRQKRSSERIRNARHITEVSTEDMQSTSTFTSTGPTRRTLPLDRVMASDELVPRIKLGQLRPADYSAAFDLTDHCPVIVQVD